MKKIYVISLLVLAFLIAFADIQEKDGKAGRTGSPNEFDCTGCHTSHPVNTGGGSITISSPNLTNWQYVPGTVYQIDVTVSKTGVGLFGFGFESLRTSNNTNAGTFTITNPAETHLKSATIAGSPRTNVVHMENGGVSVDSHTFSFNWTAPSTNIGNVRFWTAGNAADNNDDTLGDYIYKTNQIVTPFVTGIAENSGENYFSVYPIPAIDFVTMEFSETSSSPLQMQLLDSKGKMVLSKQEEKLTLVPVTLQLPNRLPGGIYFLKATAGSKTWLKKVFVNH